MDKPKTAMELYVKLIGNYVKYGTSYPERIGKEESKESGQNAA